MMSVSTDDRAARQIAVIAAAVQAYLDGEEQGSHSYSTDIRAWRRDTTLADNSAFTARRRSWTGRD